MVRILDAQRWIDRIAFCGVLTAGLCFSLTATAVEEDAAELPAPAAEEATAARKVIEQAMSRSG